MLIYSMGVSVDGFIADRERAFGWTIPDEEQFRFHLAQIRELGCYLLGRRLYETMLVWESSGKDKAPSPHEPWPVTPELAGSSPVARVQQGSAICRRCRGKPDGPR